MKWLLALCFALIPMSVRATTIEHFSPEEQAVLEERGALLDDFVDQLAANELAPIASTFSVYNFLRDRMN